MEHRPSNLKVFLACIKPTTTVEELNYHLYNFGYKSISEIELPRNSKIRTGPSDQDGLSKSIAILHFRDKHEFDDLLRRESINIQGRNVKVHQYLTGRALEEHKRLIDASRVFLRNIPHTINKIMIKQKLTQFGEVKDLYIIEKRKSNQRRPKCAYAEFNSPQIAQLAISARKIVFHELNKKIDIRRYVRNPRDNRRARGNFSYTSQPRQNIPPRSYQNFTNNPNARHRQNSRQVLSPFELESPDEFLLKPNQRQYFKSKFYAEWSERSHQVKNLRFNQQKLKKGFTF